MLPVMCRRMYDLELLQRAHSNSRCCIEVEHEERGCDRDKRVGRKSCQTVGDGTHGMLPHTVMDVPSAVVAYNPACCLQIRLRLVSDLLLRDPLCRP